MKSCQFSAGFWPKTKFNRNKVRKWRKNKVSDKKKNILKIILIA